MPSRTDVLPPPLYWANRIVAIFLILFVAVFPVRWFAGRATASRLEKFQTAARERGEPWSVEDLARPPAPLEQGNAANLYLQAYALKIRKVSGPTNVGFVQFLPDERYSAWWRKTAAAASQRYRLLYQIVHLAGMMPLADWNALQQTSFADRSAGRLQNIAFELAAESADHALDAHFNGDDAAFLDGMSDVIALARSLSQIRTTRQQFFAANTTNMALIRLQIAAADLQLDTPQMQSAATAMIQQLALLETELTEHADSAITTEAVFDRGRISYVLGNTWLMAPAFAQAQADVGRLTDAEHAAFWGNGSDDDRNAVSNLYARLGGMTAPSALMPSRSSAGALFRAGALPMWQYGENFRRLRTEMRLTRAMLAVRLFYTRHARWPSGTNELVPAEISEVPNASYGDAPSPIVFQIIPHGRPDGADRAMLYVDIRNSQNPLPRSHVAIGWQANDFDASGPIPIDPNGRLWRDLEVWPLAAYPQNGPNGPIVR